MPERAPNLSKKAFITILLAMVVVFAGGGIITWLKTPGSAKSAGMVFMTGLANGKATATYKQLSAGMHHMYSPDRWMAYVKTIGPTSSKPVFVRQTTVVDRFNVYPTGSNPQRLVYNLRINHRDYQVETVILRQDGSWKVDDLQGSYK